MKAKKQTAKEKITNKDPFNFNKAINYDKLNDPKILKTLEDIFKDKPMYETPQSAYKKAVNTLKRKVR
jgi:hypothetical protein